MQVMCIDEPKEYYSGDVPIVRIGEYYNVIDVVPSQETTSTFYELAEHEGYIYHSRLFVPLSDKDETEYADEVLVKIFQPVKF